MEETSYGWHYRFERDIKTGDSFLTDHDIECPSTNKWQWILRNKDAYHDLKPDGNYNHGVWSIKFNADCSIDPCSCTTYSTSGAKNLGFAIINLMLILIIN